MPKYLYMCDTCVKTIELEHSMNEVGIVDRYCDICGNKLRRLFIPIGFVLKGGGFYTSQKRKDQLKKQHTEFKEE